MKGRRRRIADPRRGLSGSKATQGYGQWLPLSVFQCCLTARRRAALGMRLDREIKPSDDHVMILDIGPTNQVDLRVESLGQSFKPIRREVVIV